jgi:LmbE family N-acetylglucosaminyl deacetylase
MINSKPNSIYLMAILIFGGILSFQGCSSVQTAENLSFPEVEFSSQDRILILAPHPDDEVLGCGGIIQKAVAMRIPLRIVFFTYGDNNQWSFLLYRKHPVWRPKSARAMGLVRHDEAIASAKALGVLSGNLTFLGYPDFRTLKIWSSHWGNRPPCKSVLTQAKAVPYTNAFRPGAPYKGEEVLKDLESILREFKPTKIFLSHPSDHHPDHQALYLFTRVALWDLEKEMNPTLYPYLIHYKRWPNLKGYRPLGLLEPPQAFNKKILWQVCSLKPEEIELKHTAIKKHHTQYNSNARYLLSFIRANELFGDFPVIVLKPDGSSIVLPSEHKGDLAQIPEELTDEERASFVSIEEHSFLLEKDQLEFNIKLSRPLGKAVGASLYVFGYRRDRAFAEMPKLHIKFGAMEHRVSNQEQRLPLNVIKVERRPKEITIHIPLALLNNPQYILTSVKTYKDEVPLDWISWRILEISSARF